MIDNKRKTPLAIFTYNRPNHTDLCLKYLSKCNRLDECGIYIYCDGPKNVDDIDAVQASRQVVASWAKRLNAVIVERTHNMGLDPSIVGGVTDLCGEYGRVIVIEDDLVVSPDFLDYMLGALERYKNEATVYQISGYMFPVSGSNAPDTFFLPLVKSWGWATWDRAWKAFDWHPEGYKEKLDDAEFTRKFNLDGSFSFDNELRLAMRQMYGPWDYRFYYGVFQANGKVLFPKRSLVCVRGWDATGTHCGYSPDFFQPPLFFFTKRRMPSRVSFQDQITVNEMMFNRVRRLYQNKKDKKSFLYRTQRKLYHMMCKAENLLFT